MGGEPGNETSWEGSLGTWLGVGAWERDLVGGEPGNMARGWSLGTRRRGRGAWEHG